MCSKNISSLAAILLEKKHKPLGLNLDHLLILKKCEINVIMMHHHAAFQLLHLQLHTPGIQARCSWLRINIGITHPQKKL